MLTHTDATQTDAMQYKLKKTLLVSSCLLSACFLSAGSVTAIAQQHTYNTVKRTLDWVPYTQLSTEQQEQLPVGSCGAYISPINNDNLSIDLSNAPTEASSKKSEITEKDGLQSINLIGDVIIKQGYQQLNAEQATYSEASGTITIDGALMVRQPDLLFLADKGVINQYDDQIAIDNATYVLHSSGIRGSGDTLSKDKETIVLKGGAFTHCAPGNNDWVLKGSQISINTEKNQGFATNVRLEVRGIPVFYWPYLRFPVGDARQSGFLYPTVSLSDGALDTSLPYYFNLAPNYDATLTTHFLQNHGLLLEANARHLHRSFSTQGTVEFIGDDKGSLSDSEQSLVTNGTKTAAEINPYAGQDRWLMNIDQKGGQNARWFSSLDYNEVSDYEYLDDFGSSSINSGSATSLNQQLEVGYQFDHWRLAVNNQQYQTLSATTTRPYKQLPQITFDGNYNHEQWDIDLNNEWIRFDHSDADDVGDNTLVGDRTRLNYSVGIDETWDSGFLRPRILAQHLSYNLDSSKLASGANNSPSVTVPQAIIDSGLYFDRYGDSYQQTFEPRLFYFYSPHEDQSDLTGSGTNINFDTSARGFSYSQLFNETRFSGGDRIDDANQLSIGLTTRFIGKQSGREWFSASIGKALYFDERKVSTSGTIDTDNNSPIAVALASQISNDWRMTNNTIYDDDIKEVTRNTASIKYRNTYKGLLNISHLYSRNRSKSINAAFVRPINNGRWNLIGHVDYDYINRRDTEQLWGAEYRSCCYRARIAYKRFIDDDQASTSSITYDQGVILEVQFIGLGGTGKQFDRVFSDAIDGYEDWQASYQ